MPDTRYAHELYPGPDADETRQLADEIPYLYARAIGLDIIGTNWVKAPIEERMLRIGLLEAARRTAFLADALHQGMTGDRAWQWADTRAAEESGELVIERAETYGVDPALIRPYRIGLTWPRPTRRALHPVEADHA